MSMLERVRERMFYLPTRTQARIVTTATIIVTAGGVVLGNVLTGTALTVYWGVTLVLAGVALTLVLQQRRR